MEEITYEDFAKLDLVVAKIIKAEDIENADKLYKITLDDGEGERIICAGIKEDYSKEELKGKQIIIIANLAPREMRGVVSNGMLLAADENGKPTLLIPEKDVEVGSKIN